MFLLSAHISNPTPKTSVPIKERSGVICRGFSISFNSIKPITNIHIYHKMVKDFQKKQGKFSELRGWMKVMELQNVFAMQNFREFIKERLEKEGNQGNCNQETLSKKSDVSAVQPHANIFLLKT